MNVRRMKLLLVLSLLVFGMAGVVSTVSAAGNSFNPGYGTDPYFFSPGWAPTKLTYSFSDPDFFLPSWKVPTYKPAGDPNFLYSNWSVQPPVLFRYSGIDSSRINNYNLDPFASDDELRAQGWEIKGDFLDWS